MTGTEQFYTWVFARDGSSEVVCQMCECVVVEGSFDVAQKGGDFVRMWLTVPDGDVIGSPYRVAQELPDMNRKIQFIII